MQTFYSHGKLLLTAEYVVLDGAKAFALPTKFGQTLSIETYVEHKLNWQSIDYKGDVWFEDEFSLTNGQITTLHKTSNDISERLIEILNAAKKLNPDFLQGKKGYKASSKLEFPNNWGLGSSSTLLNNIAQWAKIDAFALSNATFGGSGYDIACAQNNTPIVYQIVDAKPLIESVSFNKAFEDQLFFVHLNRKQNSRDSIKTYRDNKTNTETIILKTNTITSKLIASDSIETFNILIETHENLIGEITNQTPIKKRLFSDFKNQIKSLGGWNGDFVLVTGEKEYIKNYFTSKGYNTIVRFKDMIL
ncbi:GYDIA family GHMP kinase [Lacinutrix sp. Bg11-31]|uniref:GYDIA family GHMP kinase n=1 Tax=Lacinutrix sp. Bg11-31 TaxID=2057808 RepID=UPI000C3105F3|nr:GYDIA family GHMP kinase [Lacinutrix sp. Bg11-31]AUC82445.1 GHMP kinase [Lacinutrix sp. Bg11-31]